MTNELSEKEYKIMAELKERLDAVCKSLDLATGAGLTVKFNIRTEVGGKSTVDMFDITRTVGVPFSPPARH